MQHGEVTCVCKNCMHWRHELEQWEVATCVEVMFVIKLTKANSNIESNKN